MATNDFDQSLLLGEKRLSGISLCLILQEKIAKQHQFQFFN
jgi:hypothetical protein